MKTTLLLSTLASIGATLLLPSCVANMQLKEAVTQKGLVCTNRASLGQFFLWDNEEQTLSTINTLNTPSHNIVRDTTGSDELVRFKNAATFTGGVRLSPREQADLEAEVSSKSSLEAKGLKKYAYRNVVKAITSEMHSDADFIESMDVDHAIESDGQLLYVLVSELTLGTSLETKVQGVTALGAGGASQVFDAVSIRGGFRITDTAALNIKGTDGTETRLFYRFSVFRPSLKDGSYKFRRVTHKETLENVKKALQASSF